MVNRVRRNQMTGGFTLLELIIAIGIITLLIALLLPALEAARHQAYIDKCASNLRQIGQSMTMYATENRGLFPRARYVADAPVCQDTGAAAADPFGPGGPSPNDVTAAPFLLILIEKLPPDILICPYDDENEFVSDRLAGPGRSNFTDYRKNLGYSFANPYPSSAAVKAGYAMRATLPAGFPLASDLNPGDKPALGSSVTGVTASSGGWDVKMALSRNHERDGMNVLYADGHVDWQTTPLCGVNGDNIFTNQNNQIDASPAARFDSVLLPHEP